MRRSSPTVSSSSVIMSSSTSWKHRQRNGGGVGRGVIVSIFLQPRLRWIYGLFFGFWILKTLFLHHAISSTVDRSTSSSSSNFMRNWSSSSKNDRKQQQSQQRTRRIQLNNHAIPAAPLLWNANSSRQVEKKDKRGKVLHRSITKLTTQDIPGGLRRSSSSSSTANMTTTSFSLSQVSKGRERLLDLLQDAGVTEMDPQVIAQLPLWKQVAQLYYYDYENDEDAGNSPIQNPQQQQSRVIDDDVTEAGPVIVGLETCATFRTNTPEFDRSVGVAGLFNTGTNPAAMYLSANCYMANNTSDKAGHGMRWQVPWGKHMIASRKWNNTAGHEEKTNKTNVLPVVLVRDPWTWMQSMCKNAYGVKWEHTRDHCPNLTDSTVTIHYPGQPAQWDSLVHLWSDWYNQYYHADYPRLMVRFEDFIFRPKEVLNEICSCAGASPVSDTFSYVVDSGKWGSAHHSSNMITAMIKYGSPENRLRSFTPQDLEYAAKHLDKKLLRLFQYHLPSMANKR